MSVSYWQDRSSKTSPVSADIIIIGGGISGLSTAYWLHKEDPQLEIVLLEKGHLGAGATGKNAGFITCGSVEHFNRLVSKHGQTEAHEIWQFSEKNLDLLREHIVQEETTAIGFERKGSFSLASTASEFSELQKSAQIMKNLDIEVEVLDEGEIKKRLGAEKFVGGIKYCRDASVHPIKLLELIKRRLANAQAKLQVFEQTEVYATETSDDGQKIVKTPSHVFMAPMVVYAANGYSTSLDPFFKDKIFPTRGQILITGPVPPFMEGPCYANFVLDYFRQLPTGELLIGGFRQLEKETEVGYSDHTTDTIQKALHSFILEHLPRFKDQKITHRWAGVMGFSVDGQPMVGSLPSDPQTFFLGGFTGHGLGLSFHTAKCLVDTLFGRPIPGFLSARRFQ